MLFISILKDKKAGHGKREKGNFNAFLLLLKIINWNGNEIDIYFNKNESEWTWYLTHGFEVCFKVYTSLKSEVGRPNFSYIVGSYVINDSIRLRQWFLVDQSKLFKAETNLLGGCLAILYIWGPKM